MGTTEIEVGSQQCQVEVPQDYLVVSNSDLYQEIRGVVVERKMWGKKDQWPTTEIETSQHKAVAQIRPDPNLILNAEELIEWQEKVAKYVLKLNDLTADVLDVVCNLWLESSPKTIDSMITLKATDFLKFRGLKKRQGKGTGFSVERKREVEDQISLLSNLWIQVKSLSQNKEKDRFFRSTAITKASEVGEEDGSGKQKIYAWRVKPGDIFMPFLLGPGRVLAPLSKVALQFDPYRQKIEKRLTRYLTWIWKIRQGNNAYLQPFSVVTILESTKTSIDKRNPSKTRDRLELALDTLKSSGIISSWQYLPGTDYSLSGKRWSEDWLRFNIQIEPPAFVLNYYVETFSATKQFIQNEVEKREKLLDPVISEMKLMRKQRKLTQLQLADHLGVSGIYISKLEIGTKTPSKKMKLTISNWLLTN